MYATVHTLRNIIYGAAAKGASLQSLCDSIPLKPVDLNDAERRIDGVEPVVRLWDRVIELTKDECFGLHLGANNNTSYLGLIGYLFQNCPTLKDMIDVLQRHQKLVSGWVSFEMKALEDEVAIYYFMNPLWIKTSSRTARHAIEMSMSATKSIVNILAAKDVPILRVELEFPRNSTGDEYQKVFNSPVKFSQQYNRIFFKKDFLTTHVESHDKSLYLLFSQILHDREIQFSESISFVEKVRRIVISDFKGQVPPIDLIASHLNLSSRSFQRKLESEKSSYRVLSNELKKDLTLTLLKNTQHSTQDIAKVLGYNESTAFTAAFKSWMNETPAKWRERNVNNSIEQ